jgi:hypothetical protein
MSDTDEYSERFDGLRRNACKVSFYKYGPAKKNFLEGRVDAIKSLEKKLAAYKRTGNTEYLVDVANYAMFEFMYPLHAAAHFTPTDDDRATLPVGIPINMEKPE